MWRFVEGLFVVVECVVVFVVFVLVGVAASCVLAGMV